MRTEVYSWRLSGELKSDLEREARLRKVPVSSVLETAVRDWLKKGDADVRKTRRNADFRPPRRAASGSSPAATLAGPRRRAPRSASA